MAVVVRIPMALRGFTGGAEELTSGAGTVGAVLGDVADRFPGLRRHLYAEAGGLREYVNVFVGGDDVRHLDGEATRVEDGDVVTIVPSIAGGAALPELEPEETRRYARHLVLPEVGPDGQRKLKAARVLLVGAGGLGSPLGLYLAAAGVGTLGLVDPDTVDVSNLHRQVLYGEKDLGRSKVGAAADRLRDLNPHITVEIHREPLTSENALAILEPYDVVVDGTDNFPTRYLVNDACVLLGKPNVYGSIFRFEGQVSVFDARNGPCYRCLFREPPPPGLVPTCAEGGVLGALPGVVGSLQALETIKLITGAGEPLVGRLLLFDGLRMRWRELVLRRNPDCPVCGEEPTVTELIDYEAFCGVAAEPVPLEDEITPAELRRRLDRGEELLLLDVREPFEWEIANLESEGAVLIPIRDVPARVEELDPEADIVVYCRSGPRSADVQRYLQKHGFARVSNLVGGIMRWREEVDPGMARY